jgi:hypothetical protein
MMMQMVEAYINEEGSGCKGAFLFLDMEKAFDRVSYAFTKRGLKALGFGPNFRKWVGMMYNEDRPPRRGMYVNGYYSEWFDIKSGVAQGYPLSPLLFLIVAEALNTSFEMEPGLKGIQIGKRYYKLSQFKISPDLDLSPWPPWPRSGLIRPASQDQTYFEHV